MQLFPIQILWGAVLTMFLGEKRNTVTVPIFFQLLKHCQAHQGHCSHQPIKINRQHDFCLSNALLNAYLPSQSHDLYNIISCLKQYVLVLFQQCSLFFIFYFYLWGHLLPHHQTPSGRRTPWSAPDHLLGRSVPRLITWSALILPARINNTAPSINKIW